ncbi:MAG: DUF58 domain-containing protein [archaeon]
MAINELKVENIPGLKKLEVHTRQNVLNKALEGNWMASFKGRGMEFAGYRKYTFGDDASAIDWKASLKSKQTLVKEYEEERTLNVLLLVDVSNSMLFSSTGKLKAEYAAELVASLSFAILSCGDAVGMSMFTDRLVTKSQPNIGKTVYYMLIRDILNTKNYGGMFSFKVPVSHLLAILDRKSIIIIISDFIGMEKNWAHILATAAGQHEIIAIMIRDPRDRELPKDIAQYIVEDPYTGEKLYIDTKKFGKKYAEYARKDEEAIEHEFKKRKCDFLKLYTDQDYFNPIIAFFRKRSVSQ